MIPGAIGAIDVDCASRDVVADVDEMSTARAGRFVGTPTRKSC